MKKSRPIKIMTLDTETYGTAGALKRIAVYDGIKVVYGYTFKDVYPAIKSYDDSGYKSVVYIHFLEFDLRKIIEEIMLIDKIIWSKSFIINNRIVQLHTKSFILQDSFALLPMSLDYLSKNFDVTHAKIDLWDEVQKRYPNQYKDKGDYFIKCDKDDPLYVEYLGYDVISLYEVIHKVMEVSGLPINKFIKCITTASMSRHLFKNGHKGHLFKDPKNARSDYEIMTAFNWDKFREAETFLRDSYCGGRTEVFNMVLDHPGLHYDVNSEYPYTMLFDLPVGAYDIYNQAEKCRDIYDNWMINHDGLGFIYCDVYVPLQNIPPLPVKMGKLCFPCGNFFGVFTYEELEFAIRKCDVKIVKYHEIIHFRRTYPVFKNFVEYFFKMKIESEKNGNMAQRQFAKLVLNTGYGYTAMRRDNKTKLDDINNVTKYNEDDIVSINYHFGYVEVLQDLKSDYIQVQIGSTIASRSRMVLLNGLLCANKNGNVYYCDTDSVVCDSELPPDMVDDYELGKFKLEGNPKRGLFLAPKVYAEDLENKTNIKFKGVTKDTQRTMTYNDYVDLYNKIIGKQETEVQVESGRIMLRSIKYLQKNNLPYDHYEVRDKNMYLNKMGKRKINYDDGTTSPYFFDSIEDFKNFSFGIQKYVEIGEL